MLNNKSVLITGGTGSFGKKFVETVETLRQKIVTYCDPTFTVSKNA